MAALPVAIQRPQLRLTGTPAEIAAQIRQALKDGGSSKHASGVQWFFKEEIKSHGWYTGPVAAGSSELP